MLTMKMRMTVPMMTMLVVMMSYSVPDGVLYAYGFEDIRGTREN